MVLKIQSEIKIFLWEACTISDSFCCQNISKENQKNYGM